MASPPYASPATSPPNPYHTSLPNPKKRPSLSLSSHGPPARRRKTATTAASTPSSTHPLRQTSFPPEESAIDDAARSPSVESDVTGITGLTGGRSTATGSKGIRKRRGKRKGGDPSVRSETREVSRGAHSVADDVYEDEEDEDQEVNDDLQDGGEKVDKEAEKKKLAVLIEAFDSEQSDRYDLFRRTKLRENTLRKIVNQLLSQSVPPQVIKTINGYTKVFIGQLIERSRDVQLQRETLTPPATPPESTTTYLPTPQHTQPETQSFVSQASRSAELGPFTPDDLREALRRFKRDGTGGGTGLQGMSLPLGVTGAGAARLGGRRLFR